MATKRQRRKRRKRRSVDGEAAGPTGPVASDTKPVASDTKSEAAGAKPTRKRPGDGAPPPPWGSFPLSELVILVAIVLLFAGFFVAPPRGGVMIGVGLVLGSLAGLELAIREHFAGYKSHTLLLGGAAGVATMAGLLALGPDSLPIVASLGIGVAVFAAAAYAAAVAFRRRSGGALFRFKA